MPQRSPIIFWLLLAATLSVDAVAVSWAYAVTLPRTESLYFGLFCAQVSLVCIWAYFSMAVRIWRWLVPMAVLLASVLLTTWLYNRDQSNGLYDALEMGMVYFSLWLAQMLLVFGAISFLHHTSVGERWSRHSPHGRWQFSMKHILAVMTLTPIGILILREAKIIHDVWFPFVVWTANNAILAVLAAIVHTARWSGIIRPAVLAFVASLFGVVIALTTPGAWESLAINLIQVLVLFVWLEFGQLIPQRDGEVETAVAGSPTNQ